MSFLKDVSNVFAGVANVIGLGTNIFNSLPILGNAISSFLSWLGNDNTPTASQTATTVTQPETNGTNGLSVSRTTEQEETARLNQLFSVMRTEQGATPTT